MKGRQGAAAGMVGKARRQCPRCPVVLDFHTFTLFYLMRLIVAGAKTRPGYATDALPDPK
jgi:hypothetical protein